MQEAGKATAVRDAPVTCVYLSQDLASFVSHAVLIFCLRKMEWQGKSLESIKKKEMLI
jgi:hypothetical protein